MSIYSNPTHYPPTLNALSELSRHFEEVDVQYRPYGSAKWNYPENIKLHPSGAIMSAREQEALPLHRRWGLVAGFIKDMVLLCREKNPEVVLLFDPLPLMAFFVARVFLRHQPIVWYHNHDVLAHGNLKKFSLAWLAAGAEKRMFRHLDIFSLPADERKAYFPMKFFKGKYFFLPNLPATTFYQKYLSNPFGNALRLIYQGTITERRGIEEVISILPCQVNGKDVHLILAGWVYGDYGEKLSKLIKERNAGKFVEMKGYIAYHELPELTSSCHIGMAMYTQVGLIYTTLGTASNKMYEYAAAGLPVLYFDNPHFQEHLGKYEWAFPVDLSKESLLKSLKTIDDHLDQLSQAARRDFMNGLNYEQHFQPMSEYLNKLAPAT